MILSDDVVQTVKKLATLVVNSNKITEMHEKNMKMYPLIYFDGVKSVQVDYDLSRRHDVDTDDKNNMTIKNPLRNNFVAYYLIMNEDVKNENLDKRFQALEGSIRTLFWKDVSTEVYFNGKIAYKSAKK